MKPTIFLSVLTFFVSTTSLLADAPKLEEWTIKVRMYRGYPPGEFKALNELAVIVANETSKGFLNKTVINRDDVHPGATFCLLVDPRVHTAKEERARILDEIRALKPDGQFVEFSVASPSDCALKNEAEE